MSDAHGHGDHPDFLQHHFDSPLQQFDSTKLGMWLFLATEILLFGGLFVAYSVYRGNHPEIFYWAQHFLDTEKGAINTVILLCSSLTMAWAVRAAQLNQRGLLVMMLCLTLLGGCGFMGIKYFEYKAKWEHGLLWARDYEPHDEEHGGDHAGDHAAADGADADHGDGATGDHGAAAAGDHGATDGADDHGAADAGAADHGGASDHAADAMAAATAGDAAQAGFAVERTTLDQPAAEPRGRAVVHHEEKGGGDKHGTDAPSPDGAQVFFSIYFLMTGLHGLHVIIGMGAILWVLFRSVKGDFSSAYFTPVDLVGLYWHLVDLIWIFLFPLLYLIG